MSKTMPTWLTEASVAVTEATNAAEVQRQIESLTVTRTAFAEHLKELRRFAQADALGRKKWWDGYVPNPELFKDLKQSSKILQPRAIYSLTLGLVAYSPAIKAELINGWRAYAGDRMGNVADLQQLAGTLADVDGVADLARRFQEVLGQLGRLQDQVPTQESLALLDQAEQHLAILEAALQPEDVRRFLSAVARGGAALDLLTEDVRTWLHQHGAKRNFKVIAGAPADNT